LDSSLTLQGTVLVVEYGDLVFDPVLSTPAATVIDPLFMFTGMNSVPQAGLNNRSFTVTVGKVVGGSSAINAQMFDRGSASDYDAWGAVNRAQTTAYDDAGWNWKGLLPYFKKVDFNSKFRTSES
jgi:choline dehydrogenase-like flavoprotein